MLQPDIKSVKSMPEYKLLIEYSNGELRMFDMTPYLNIPFYSKLADVDLFNTVHVVDDGWTVEWDNEYDIPPEELYKNSVAL